MQGSENLVRGGGWGPNFAPQTPFLEPNILPRLLKVDTDKINVLKSNPKIMPM